MNQENLRTLKLLVENQAFRDAIEEMAAEESSLQVAAIRAYVQQGFFNPAAQAQGAAAMWDELLAVIRGYAKAAAPLPE